jgi:hypothetical protein
VYICSSELVLLPYDRIIAKPHKTPSVTKQLGKWPQSSLLYFHGHGLRTGLEPNLWKINIIKRLINFA